MNRLQRFSHFAAILSFLLIAGFPGPAPAIARQADCRIGTYRLADGSDVDIRPVDDTHLRWQRKDGTTGKLTRVGGDHWVSTLGWTDHPDGTRVSFDCAARTIEFGSRSGKRIDFDVVDTRFQGAGVELAGRLVMPRGTGKVPVVVLVHGSEHDSALDFYALQRLFPSEGIGAFVYDKRGTGRSGGRYTQDFLTLADDAIAAMHEARRLAGTRSGRVGYQAGSEGGWVAPLAARIEPADFLIVGFGLAVSPLEEDREAIALDMAEGGYGPEAMSGAMDVSRATRQVLLSDFRDGYDGVEAVKKKYGSEPWFTHVRGDVSWIILQKSESWLRQTGPTLFPGIPLNYDPMPVLRNLETPQLWILAQNDLDAPSAETARRLAMLTAEGRPITSVMFPRTEHGIYEYEMAPDGSRVSTRQPEGYFRMMRDFILNGEIGPNYGDARILARPNDRRPPVRRSAS
jgi:pimeloyl-ACP methyl ester carboxylesterase